MRFNLFPWIIRVIEFKMGVDIVLMIFIKSWIEDFFLNMNNMLAMQIFRWNMLCWS